ncbi:helix-turn-helix domain-containing protein [Ruegeria sp. 2205SS24-7]|uniref:helix-turn-helix domain-containing protein n=1 Tax=Ruegeria discodermiae TaxID=3064389 RepID=UPI00274069C0|nr:helix-turn-helix domain-containing protein [Ruegeria sp. 2205SS24-7]MDP5220852.1 helix-turn-helix domain-containing protein [Ruegeria sp. 2205SS24-7]
MVKRTNSYKNSFEDPESLPSPYDREEDPDDLWFLPDPEYELDGQETPLPKANATSLVRPDEWIAAQGKHAPELARAALAVGQLDMLVAQIGPGALERLALREVEALVWAAGTPVSVEEIGRDQLQARATTDLGALQQTRWAVRRLMGEGPAEYLRAFLGLHRVETSDLAHGLRARITGEMFDEAAAEFQTRVAGLTEAHAFTRAAFARNLWRLSELSLEEDQIEGPVWAARLMAQGCQTLTFVPLGQGARQVQSAGARQLGAYLNVIESGATAARVELQRLTVWRDRAREHTNFIRGNNPARIIDALVVKPMATTEMIEKAAGVSRDTAERLLARMADMDLAREVTGASRFRIWSAKI